MRLVQASQASLSASLRASAARSDRGAVEPAAGFGTHRRKNAHGRAAFTNRLNLSLCALRCVLIDARMFGYRGLSGNVLLDQSIAGFDPLQTWSTSFHNTAFTMLLEHFSAVGHIASWILELKYLLRAGTVKSSHADRHT